MLPNGPSWVLRSAHCWVGGRHAAGLDEHSRLARALEDYSSAHRGWGAREVNRVAVEREKSGEVVGGGETAAGCQPRSLDTGRERGKLGC